MSISGGLPQQFNRAIDLSALAAKKTPPQDSVSAGGSARRDVDENSLVKEIIPGSKQVPLILVVWSPRSEESKLLVQALEALHQDAVKQSTILLKGSRGMKLESLLNIL